MSKISDKVRIPFRRTRLTHTQEQAMIEARIAFMKYSPFFCYYFYDQMEEYPTSEIDTLGTDSRRIYYNPVYVEKLKPGERAFALTHEVEHAIYKHPQRGVQYEKAKAVPCPKGPLPYDHKLFNIACDLVINADLIRSEVGSCNPAWLYDPKYTGSEAVEAVYEDIYRPPPPPPPGGRPGKPGDGPCIEGQPGDEPGDQPTTGVGRGDLPKHGKHGKPDKQAEDNQGRFDELLPPLLDPIDGTEDSPDEMEFKEALARAAHAAKEMGKMPGHWQRVVDEILEPQITWKDHMRFMITGKIGQRREDWSSPNRRRVVLNPMIYLPGKQGHGCNDVTVVIDNSGSIGENELSAFFAETCAILADCRPKLVRVIWCDYIVQRVEEARCLDELAHIRQQGSKGGGGTAFEPPFKWLVEHDIKTDALVYLTDMEGTFPADPKTFPVIWCASTDRKGPFGETVHIKV